MARRRALVFRRLSAVYVTHAELLAEAVAAGRCGRRTKSGGRCRIEVYRPGEPCGHHCAADNGVDQVATVFRNVDPNFSAGFAEHIAAVARGISERQVYAAGRAPQGGVAQNEWED